MYTLLQWLDEHAAEMRVRSPALAYMELLREALAICPQRPRVLKADAFNEATRRYRTPISELVPDACCIEIEAATVAQARVNCPKLDIRQGDVRDLPWEAGTFDLVVDLSTIDHIQEPGTALREYARVLKARGVLLIVAWVNMAPGTVSGESGYGGTQYFFDVRNFRKALREWFDVVDGRILTPAGADPDRLVVGQRVPFADLHAYVCRRRVD